jgi:hypothetical protein
MDWFETLTGFAESPGEAGAAQARQRLQVHGQRMLSLANGREFGIGRLELMPMHALRSRALAGPAVPGLRQVHLVQGNVRAFHALPAYSGALFQVASQFNLLEMVGPKVTPEQGVARYAGDPTQGPACAIAAGAATIYRNYLAPVGGQTGQSHDCQLDAFAPLGAALAQAVHKPAASLWDMQNGYALFKPGAVALLSAHLQTLDEAALDALRAQLCIGLHWDVEVTDAATAPGPLVSQAFCSALPVAYHRGTARDAPWAPLATLVLQAAYEATLWAAVANAQRGGSRTVLLTMLGGGAFGNAPAWIEAAVEHALARTAGYGLDVAIVSFQAPTPEQRRWVQSLGV